MSPAGRFSIDFDLVLVAGLWRPAPQHIPLVIRRMSAVGLPHAFAGQGAHVADGVLDALDDNAVAAVELAVVLLHLPAQQARLHRRGDFGCTAGLGAVADHARVDGYRVDDGVGDLFVPPAVQVAHPGPGAAPGGGGPAVGGQAADAGFQVNGHQV